MKVTKTVSDVTGDGSG